MIYILQLFNKITQYSLTEITGKQKIIPQVFEKIKIEIQI